ncbi:MAG TPA: DUF3667 domain-containing protein [Sphingomicrobium sp.]|nr:DUF3667 domain-containing protein [Sphingomicrobium sp.]
MSEIDGIGEAVTGGLIARAVEPQAGEAVDDGHTHEQCCLNCGMLLMGPYCSSCGQKAHVHRSLIAFWQDMVQGLFNFEGKIWRTLPMLAWRPGEMTRRYIDGERARFISPAALYLFSVFLMFAVLNFNGAIGPDVSNIRPNLAIAADDERAKIAKLEEQRKAAAEKGESTTQIERRLAARKKDLAQIEGLQRGQPIQFDATDAEEAPAWARELIVKVASDPEAAVFKVQDAASKYSWALIPLSVPFMWLLFPLRRRFHLYDHTVFVTYSLSFMMGLVIVGGVLIAVGWAGWASLLFFVPPFHIYWQLKGAYQLSRFGALWRTIVLLIFSFIVLGLFAAMMVGLGLFD